jgi:glycosyltransferase involved in cell wall biosynthesis
MLTVGVVVPFYNHMKFVKEAIDSLLAQTRLPDAIVVVDDGSKPKERDALWDYLYYNLSILAVKHPENWGVSAAKNSGILHLLSMSSPPNIIICLDADDMLAPGYVEMMVNALDEHPEALVAYPDVQMFGFESRVMKAPRVYDPSILSVRPFIVNGAAFRTELWKEIYRYNSSGWDTTSDKWGWEDYLFWLEGLLGVARGDPSAAVHAGPDKFWYLYRRFNRRDRSDGNEELLWRYMKNKLQTIYGLTLPPMPQEWLRR